MSQILQIFKILEGLLGSQFWVAIAQLLKDNNVEADNAALDRAALMADEVRRKAEAEAQSTS